MRRLRGYDEGENLTPSIFIYSFWHTHNLVKPLPHIGSPEFLEFDDLKVVVVRREIVTSHLLFVPVGSPIPVILTKFALDCRVRAGVVIHEIPESDSDPVGICGLRAVSIRAIVAMKEVDGVVAKRLEYVRIRVKTHIVRYVFQPRMVEDLRCEESTH